ncbi:MAG: hypothetical protein KAS02_01495 [Candidatus Pacebacteria bacterium]|nr:hypothetical protein [Candidatus Paceibacterota bacterium]
MKKIFLILIIVILISFFAGYSYKDVSFDEDVQNYPKGSLNIPAQWFMMDGLVGWERMMFIFGYADNVDVCQHLVEVAKAESPDRDFRCTDAN